MYKLRDLYRVLVVLCLISSILSPFLRCWETCVRHGNGVYQVVLYAKNYLQ